MTTVQRKRWVLTRMARGTLAVLLVSVGAAPSAHAQTPATGGSGASTVPAGAPVATGDEAQRTAIARAMFEDGLRFVDASSWNEAADRFARVLEIRYSAVAAYNYALAADRLGKLVVAAETLRKVLADAALDPKVRASAEALRSEVDAKVGWLTLRMGERCRGCRLRVDDQDWPTAAWGVAAPIDPGTHAIVLARGGITLLKQQLEIAPGAHVEQTMAQNPTLTPAKVAASAAAHEPSSDAALVSEPPAATAHAGSGGVLRSPWFWIAVGAVAAAAITAVVVVSGSGTSQAPAVKGDFTPGAIEGRVTP